MPDETVILDLSKLHQEFGAEVRGVDLAAPLGNALRNAIDNALETRAVLLFRGQSLDQDSQIAMARRFGTLDTGFKKASRSPGRFRYEELLDISNVGANGAVAEPSHPKIVGNIANQLWHSDSSFQAPATSYSMLFAKVLPPSGSVTEYVDCRIAHEALPADRKAELEDLVAQHHALHSRFLLGDDDYDDEQRRAIPPAQWPIVREQPSTGRRTLFIGAHAQSVNGMTVPEGRMLLMDLLEHATHPDRIYRHEWQEGDLVMWDNRTTLHRGRRWNLSERRELRRTTVLARTA